MLHRRTDLAVEAAQLWRESAGESTKLEGVEARESLREGFPVTTVRILNARGAKALGKPVGTYVTLDLSALIRRENDAFGRAARALAGELRTLLGLPAGAPALVVGLGNRAITPDAVGPLAAEHILATRHLVEGLPAQFGHFRPVAALAPGVLGTTGVESGELVGAVSRQVEPACVVAVDALASRSLHRLCTTVQLSDTGIVPGSGVGNARAVLNRDSLGIPVVAVGVPTVVDGATLACDLLEEAGHSTLDPQTLQGAGDLMVTTRDIDARVADMGKVIGMGLNLALQTGMTVEELTGLMD